METSHNPLPSNRSLRAFLGADTRTDMQEELVMLANRLSVHKFDNGQEIVTEGDPGDSMYFVELGTVEIVKKDESGNDQVISRLNGGDFFGELALMSNAPRAATVRASGEVVAYRLSKGDFEAMIQTNPKLNGVFLQKLYRRLTGSFRDLEHKNEELKQANQLRVELGSIFTNVVLVISIYTFALVLLQSDFLLHYKHAATIQYLGARLVEGITLLLIIRIVVKSSLPIRSFGLTLQGWKRAALEAVIISVPVMALLYFLKWASIRYGFDVIGDGQVLSFSYFDYSYITYLVIAPLQEFIARGVMQGSIQRLLVGKLATFWAIVITAFLFGSLHLYSSVNVGIAAVVSSFLWGWLYARHRTLVGAGLNHFIIGNFAGLLGFWSSF